MKKCDKCRFVNDINSAFCSNCGNSLNLVNIDNNIKGSNRNLNISLIFSIMSLVFLFLFHNLIFSVVFGIIGIILWKRDRKEGYNKKISLILCLISLWTSISFIIVGIFLLIYLIIIGIL